MKKPLTAIGEFNIAFCDSRKYRNPKGIISHFALAKYFAKIIQPPTRVAFFREQYAEIC